MSVLAVTCLAALPSSGGQIPRKAEELVIKSSTGMETMLSKYRGKVVALEFILTTCPHCQQSCKNNCTCTCATKQMGRDK